MTVSEDPASQNRPSPPPALLNSILAATSDHIYAFDSDGRFLYCNETGAKSLGLTPKSIVGKLGIEIGAPRSLVAKFDSEREVVFKTRSSVSSSVIYPTPEGMHEFEYTFSPIMTADGEVTAVVFTGRDVHVRNQDLQALRDSEARFKALFEHSHDAIGVAAEGKHIFVNAAYAQMYGFGDPSELVGTPVLDRVAKGDQERIHERMVRRTQGKAEPFTYELMVVRADGSTFEVENRVSLLQWGHQTVTLVIQQEVTEMKRTLNALRDSNQRYAATIASALDCVITIDESEQVMEWNPAAEKTFGISRSMAIGQPLSSLIIPPSYRHAHASGIKHFLETGEGPVLNKRIEVTAMRVDGTEFPAELTATPFRMDGRYVFTAYIRDITDRKLAAAQQRIILRDVLASVTEGRLRLCTTQDELPPQLTMVGEFVPLTVSLDVRVLRQCAQEVAATLSFPDSRMQDIVTATSEAAMNALLHAGAGIGHIHTDHKGTLQVWVEDNGTGIEVADLPQATLQRGWSSAGTLGHGMKMMLRTCDRIYLLTSPDGTTVVLEQDRDGSSPNW